MSLMSFFLNRKKPASASLAKDRLQIIIARERTDTREGSKTPDFMPQMRKELLEVIRKYVPVDEQAIKLSFDHQNNLEVLDINVVFDKTEKTAAPTEAPVAATETTEIPKKDAPQALAA